MDSVVVFRVEMGATTYHRIPQWSGDSIFFMVKKTKSNFVANVKASEFARKNTKIEHAVLLKNKARLRGLWVQIFSNLYCSNGSHPGKLQGYDNTIVFKETRR